jgi:uncharacterized protein related to proFAR isomerase
MTYNESALDEFLESLNLSEEKYEAVKKLYIAQLEYLIRDDVSADTINEVSGLNIPMIKGFNFLKNMGEEFKKNFSEIFEEEKKEK